MLSNSNHALSKSVRKKQESLILYFLLEEVEHLKVVHFPVKESTIPQPSDSHPRTSPPLGGRRALHVRPAFSEKWQLKRIVTTSLVEQMCASMAPLDAYK